MTEKVLKRLEGKVAIVTISRPEVHNCIDDEAAAQMDGIFDELELDDAVRAVILTGSGHKSFCSGVDLKLLAEQGPELIPKVILEGTGWAGNRQTFLSKTPDRRSQWLCSGRRLGVGAFL